MRLNASDALFLLLITLLTSGATALQEETGARR